MHERLEHTFLFCKGLPSETGRQKGLFCTDYKRVNPAGPKGGNVCVLIFYEILLDVCYKNIRASFTEVCGP